MSSMKTILGNTSIVLACIGAINWGLEAVFNFNLVTGLISNSIIAKIVYVIISVAGVYGLYYLAFGRK